MDQLHYTVTAVTVYSYAKAVLLVENSTQLDSLHLTSALSEMANDLYLAVYSAKCGLATGQY